MNGKFEEVEIAPGILYRTKDNKHEVILRDLNGESIRWEYEEILHNPASWYDSLRAVALAMRYGPTAAKNQISQEYLKKLIPSGMIVCNVCGSLFGVDPTEFYRFVANLNGKTFHEFQCSDACHNKRKDAVYNEELGRDFMDKWSKDIYKKKVNCLENFPIETQNSTDTL